MTGHSSTAPKAPTSYRLSPTPPVRSRYRGCLLGGAIGDALGAPVEFMSREEILARFGPAGITDITTAFGRRGAITDDTQMTLFTAEGLLRAHTQAATQGTTKFAHAVAFAYLRWLKTQGKTSLLLEESGDHGWLVGLKELHSSRVPGNTCLESLAEMRAVGARARNDSKGCGAAMRIAPVGLFCARAPGASIERAARNAFDLGIELAGLTHGHPTGQVAAGAFAAIVAQLARGAKLFEAIRRVEPLVARKPLADETLRSIAAARQLAASGTADAAKLATLGEGWVAEEALAIALYAALAAPDFRTGVLLAVNHDGDSDSTGAIAGNLLGTMYGIEGIPRSWLAEVELGDAIATIADDLGTYPDWPVGEYLPQDDASDYWLKRYPPG